MDLMHGVVALTEHPEVLARLKRLGMVKPEKTKFILKEIRRTDGQLMSTEEVPNPRFGKDYFVTQFDGQFITFYSGEQKTFPANIARALEASNLTNLDVLCDHCKGKGSTVAGLCINCKGKKFIADDKFYRVLKVIRVYNAMLVDPESIRERVSATPAPETDTAIA